MQPFHKVLVRYRSYPAFPIASSDSEPWKEHESVCGFPRYDLCVLCGEKSFFSFRDFRGHSFLIILRGSYLWLRLGRAMPFVDKNGVDISFLPQVEDTPEVRSTIWRFVPSGFPNR